MNRSLAPVPAPGRLGPLLVPALALLLLLVAIATAAAPAPLIGQVAAARPPATRQNPLSAAWLAANHGLADNIWTAEYEARMGLLGAPPAPPASTAFPGFRPLFGPDVRMSSPAFDAEQNEFQIDINPTNSLNAIGTSNDYQAVGVGIYRTTDGGQTWATRDAPAPPACCDPGVAYAYDGSVYVIILNANPFVTYIIKSTDSGATWSVPTSVQTNDRPNIVVDNGITSPRRGTVYLTYTDENASNRIKGYLSSDGGTTWSNTFFVGDVISSTGFEQGSQPRVAGDGTLYVGYQQYNDINAGCAAGVQDVVARSTDGGQTWAYTVLPILQGGSCLSSQNGRGVFCYTTGGASFRSRSSPILGISPTNPQHVYMVYSGGDLELPYTCATATGYHSDTLFRRSTDGGTTWTAPQRINGDPLGHDQYYPWLSVTPNGTLWAGWHDRREDPNNFRHRWYQAWSTDEGATWSENAVADVTSLPFSFIGDYAGLAATDNRVLPMWWDSRSKASGDPYTDPANGELLTATPTPPVTPTAPTATPTSPTTATRTPTATATATPTVCAITFTDVDQNNPFYSFIRCLACRGIVSGYADGTYRWGANVTRGQLSKIIANAAGLTTTVPSTQQSFEDVPASNAFWLFVERLAATGAISGYACGGVGEPCVPPGNRAYFRWTANATRSQISKITAIAAALADAIPTTQQTFEDVPGTNPFWLWIEQLAGRGVISGYGCGGAGEPCVPPGNRPYFRWTANATRGQMAKIAAQTFFPNCQTPAR